MSGNGPMDLIALALAEDLGSHGVKGDVTSTAFIPKDSRSVARIVARESCVVSGLALAN